jgi:hypothetical protein
MSDETVVKEATGADGRQYRVRVELDDGADMPYDDGSVPLWRVEYRGIGWRAEQVEMTSFDASDVALGDAVAKFGGPAYGLTRYGAPTEPLVERWLKAFHGSTVVETWHSGDAWYLAADTARWREAMGVTPEQIREEAQRGSLMAEYQAWVQGQVYGYVVERKAVEYTVVTDPNSGAVIGTRREETWVEVEDGSVWGLYGYEWATRAAEEALAEHLGADDTELDAGQHNMTVEEARAVIREMTKTGITDSALTDRALSTLADDDPVFTETIRHLG